MKSATVKVWIADKYGRILLVKEKPDPWQGGKPAGWDLPGGNVESHESLEDIFNEILKLMRQNKLFKEELLIHIPKKDPCVLAAVREVLEETGFLVKIEEELYRKEENFNHEVVIYRGVIIDGELRNETGETSDAGWFFCDNLPSVGEDLDESDAIYPAEKKRIVLVIDERNMWPRLVDLKYAYWMENALKEEAHDESAVRQV